MTKMKDELLDELEAIKLSIEIQCMERQLLEMGIAVQLGSRCGPCGRMYSHPRNGSISSFEDVNIEDINILPLQQPYKEPAAQSQQEEPDKTTISILNTFRISAYFSNIIRTI